MKLSRILFVYVVTIYFYSILSSIAFANPISVIDRSTARHDLENSLIGRYGNHYSTIEMLLNSGMKSYDTLCSIPDNSVNDGILNNLKNRYYPSFSTILMLYKSNIKSYNNLRQEDTRKYNSERPNQKGHPRYPGSIDPTTLQKGQVFFVSRRTPLMPYLDPPKGANGIAAVKYLLPGGAFKIYNVSYSHGSEDPWYRVYGINPNGSHIGYGWVNSGVLFGQNLREYKEK